MKLIYSELGSAVSDASAESLFLSYYNNNMDLSTSTENVILAARALVADGVCSSEQIELYFEDTKCEINSDSRVVGNCDFAKYSDEWLDRILWPVKKEN